MRLQHGIARISGGSSEGEPVLVAQHALRDRYGVARVGFVTTLVHTLALDPPGRDIQHLPTMKSTAHSTRP